MIETLQEAVKHRGSSLADEQYVDLFGRPGEYQQHHKVYAREGRGVPALPGHDRARRKCRRPLHLLLLRVPGLTRPYSTRFRGIVRVPYTSPGGWPIRRRPGGRR